MFERQGEDPPLPELEAGDYLLEALFKMRPTRTDGMGAERPVDWPVILAFAQGSQRVTEAWEIELLADMACAYIEGKVKGADVFSIMPLHQGWKVD